MQDYIILSVRGNSFHLEVRSESERGPDPDSFAGEWRTKLTEAKYGSKFSRAVTVCPVADTNAAVVHARWTDRIRFEDDVAKALFERYLFSGLLKQRVVDIHAKWSESGEVPAEAASIQQRPEMQLGSYQLVPAAASRMMPGYALFMEQGTGKTAVVVARVNTDAAEQRERGETRMHRTLIVCPKNVRTNWKREFAKFSTLKGKVTVIKGGAVKRIRELHEAMSQFDEEAFTVCIISYGLLVESWDSVLSFVAWDLAVLDEGHAIKWHQTDRTQTCMRVRDGAKSRMILTGTPVVNSALDLYSQLEFLDRGLSGHTNFKGFRDKYGVFVKTGDGTRDVQVAVQNMPLLKQRLAECAYVVRKDQVLKDLPERTFDIREVEMTARQQADYDALSKQYALEIEQRLIDADYDGDDGKREMVVQNAIVQLMKLTQITSGFLIVPEERDAEGTVISEKALLEYSPNPKLDAMVEECRQLPPLEKMLIWSCFTYDIRTISKRLRDEDIDHVVFHGATSDRDRAEAERRINEDPRCRYLVGNPEAGGVGLNFLGYVPGVNDHLNTNVTLQLWYAQGHKPVSRWQADDRNHRRGTRVPVTSRDLVVPDTIDEDIRVRVLEKKKHALDVQDLREILGNILRRTV